MAGMTARDTHDFRAGNITPQSFHWRVRDLKCSVCGKQATLAARVYAPLDGIPPAYIAVMGMARDGKVPVVQTKFGPFVRVGEAAACGAHASDMERECAKHPDTWFVEFDRGPDPTNKRQISAR